MKTVELWDSNQLLGVIYPCQSGVEYTNQVGGTACAHPKIEGVFIPLPQYWFDFDTVKDPLEGFWHPTGGREDMMVGLIQKLLDENDLLKLNFRAPTLQELKEKPYVAEAWVPLVCITDRNSYKAGSELLGAFKDFWVYLTYPNSD
jgi:hypothetical protein